MTDDTRRGDDSQTQTLDIFLVAVEESGDRLGAALMRALRARAMTEVRFFGVGGHNMAAEGLSSLHSTEDFSIIGFMAVPRRLPAIVRDLRDTIRAIREIRPHILVVIDSPGYTMWLARFVRRAVPSIPIVDYVSPSVWAWRSGRARSMRRFIDHVLALLPFEPEVHRKLGGPPCTYVGHPAIDEVATLRPNAMEAQRRLADPPVVLVLLGSRSSEVRRLAAIFGKAIGKLRDRIGPIEVVLPTVPHLLERVTEAVASWPVAPQIVTDLADKKAAFRSARVALAKSGTVTLELALAGVPMVVAYKVSALDYVLARLLVQTSSVVLANLVLGENAIPEFIQADCTADLLASALAPLVGDTPERARQLAAFARLDEIMQIGSSAPAARAADVVLTTLRQSAGSNDSPFAGKSAKR